jgi:hypothetical protein
MALVFNLEFDSGLNQIIVPDKIRFTSSKNDQTSTLTLTFSKLSLFSQSSLLISKKNLIKSISFKEQDYTFSTKDIRIIWLKGKPCLLEAIFLITSEVESIKLKKLFKFFSKKMI